MTHVTLASALERIRDLINRDGNGHAALLVIEKAEKISGVPETDRLIESYRTKARALIDHQRKESQ